MIKMYIGDEEVYSNQNFTIKEEFLNTSSVILNNVYPISWEENKDYVSRFYFPKDYSKFRLYDNDKLIFCGIVKNTGNISLNPRYPHYCSLEILDFKTLLSEGAILDFVISNKTIREAIELIVNYVSDYGFVVGDIDIDNADTIIGAYSTLNKSPYDVLQYLADISGSKWFTRVIDENTIQVNFYASDRLPDAIDIDYTTEYFNNNNIEDISFSFATRDYRNKQVVTSDQVYANVLSNDTMLTDGYATSFSTSQTIGTISSISINDEEATFATKSEKALGITADFYYSTDSNTIESADLISGGSTIKVSYYALVSGRQVVYNNNEINRINTQTNRNGTISRYEQRNDITDTNQLQQLAETYLKYKGSVDITLKVKTFDDKDILDIGERVQFNMPYIEDLNTNYLVKKKNINVITADNFQYITYNYELSSNFNSEDDINYFDNQRNKANGNIAEGDFITRNIDIVNDCYIIFSNLEITKVEDYSTNTLNSKLNAVLTK